MYYEFKLPPRDLPGLVDYVSREFRTLAETLAAPAPSLNLAMLYAPPAKYADGLIVLADGTLWNPGSGAGVYCYRAGAWRFLG